MSARKPDDTNAGPNVAVFVLAMHRSGSSALTRAINLLGYDLGTPETLMNAKPDNPLGFWEQEPLQHLNDRMLRSLGRDWDTFAPVSPAHLVELKEVFGGEMRRLIREVFREHPRIVWKDPRILLVFDLWRDVFREEGYTVKPVLCIRHPAAAAQSLRKRNDFPLLKGVAIWVAYHARFFDVFDTLAFSVVDYDRLLKDWRTELGRCFSDLGLRWPESVPEAELNSFLREEHRHNTPFCLEAADQPFGFPAEALYHELIRHGRNQGVAGGLREALSIYVRSSQVFAGDVENAIQTCDRLNQQREILEKAYRDLEEAYVSRGVLLEKNAQSRQTLETEFEDHRVAYRELEGWAFHLQNQLRDKDRVSEQVSGELNRLRASWSWRLTGPLRMGVHGLRLSRRFISVAFREFPAGVRLLKREGLRSFCAQSFNRLQKERDLLGAGGAGAVIAQVAPSVEPSKSNHRMKALFAREQTKRLEQFLAEDEKIDFTPDRAPGVAVLLVLFNRAELTLSCLRALKENAGEPVELIIIDNASTDQTGELLDRLEGVTLIRNTENLHFLKACNQARDRVQSEFLLFLNNDARICRGALQAALDVYETQDNVGAVGGKIILLDGTLQEAGSILWSDGSCLGYGRGGDPEAPEYNFLRPVDFCSGAFLLTPSRLFKELGGFDERFAPAYYEETDYCMRLRALGYSTYYQPRACVEHVEFGSSTAPSKAVELQLRNRETFVEIHRDALRAHFVPGAAAEILKARFAAPAGPRLLYVDDRVPHPELGSGFPRARLIVDLLVSSGFNVTLIPLNFPLEDTYERAHEVVSPRVEVMRGCGRQDLSRFLSSRPGYYDVVWVSRPDNMTLVDQYLDAKPEVKGSFRLVYDAEAVFANRERSKAALCGAPLSEAAYAEKLRKEIEITRHADVIVSVSEAEAAAFQIYRETARSVIIRHAFSIPPATAPFTDRSDLLFVGNLQVDGSPNVDSIVWFVQEVWESVRTQIPDIKLHVIGRTGARAIEQLRAEGVRMYGAVPDLTDWYQQCRLFIAPTRFSAGIPLKVLEAAANGIPSVMTDGLAHQLGWTGDVDAGVVAGHPNRRALEFADQVTYYYTNQTAWNRLQQNGLERIRTGYSLETMRGGIEQALHF
ncbi:MAG: glycosyltransferase [Verrucomicrobia bacterium]|nr:glycosyltransferase [Verrucomicrobiota bacterium]